MAAIACAVLTVPLIVGCGSHTDSSSSAGGANLPPVDDTRGGMSSAPYASAAPAPARAGMSTKKKLVLLAGAAALYYLYRKHQANNNAAAASAQNGEPIYYLSKNGRVYYRDADHRAHWVTPPPQGIQVPYDEAQRYQGLDQFQGYDGSQNGYTDLTRYATPSGGM